jgi:hypothetical protein
VGILLSPRRAYDVRKERLAPERREFLTFEEEEIASNPEQYRIGGFDEVRYRKFEFEGVAGFIAFRVTGQYDGELIEFRFLDDP